MKINYLNSIKKVILLKHYFAY